MSGIRLDWHGPACERAVDQAIKRAVTASAITVQNQAKRLLSVAGTGRRGRKRVYGTNPSAPGQPPAKQRGALRASIAYEIIRGAQARVGTPLKYGLYLELGTQKIQSRPWLRRALEESRPAIMEIFARRIQERLG